MQRRGEEGAAAVEFALILFPLVVFLLGIIEVGWIFYHLAVITNASREGARYGIVMSDPRHSAEEIKDVVEVSLRRFSLEIQRDKITPTPTPCTSGSNLTVKVEYSHQFLTGLPKLIPGLVPEGENSLPLGPQTVMRCE